MRLVKPEHEDRQAVSDPLPFPVEAARKSKRAQRHGPRFGITLGQEHLDDSIDDVLSAFDSVSRRITDLARELKCLGYFDDHEHGPRAA
jgi:hypothetical protein